MADEDVSRAEVTVPRLVVTEALWPAKEVLVLRRNLTVTTSPKLRTPAVLTFLAQKKVRLTSWANLILDGVASEGVRRENVLRAPGNFLMTVGTPDTVGATVILQNGALRFNVCLTPALQVANVAGVHRPLPGVNQIRSTSQEGCTNASFVKLADGSVVPTPVMDKCYASRMTFDDLATAGADLDFAARAVPTYYNVQMINTSVLCMSLVEDACVLRLGPLPCIILAQQKYDEQQLIAAGTALAPDPGSGGGGWDGGGAGAEALPVGEQDARSPGASGLDGLSTAAPWSPQDDGGGSNVTAIVVGSVVGGTVLIAAIVLAVWGVQRYRRLRAACANESSSAKGGDDRSGTDGAVTLDIAAAAAAAGAGGAGTVGGRGGASLVSPPASADSSNFTDGPSCRSGTPAEAGPCSGPTAAARFHLPPEDAVISPITPPRPDLQLLDPTDLRSAAPNSKGDLTPRSGGAGRGLSGWDCTPAPSTQGPSTQGPSTGASVGSALEPAGSGGTAGGGAGQQRGEDVVSLIPNSLLGKGNFGKVVVGMYRGQRVAVKLINELDLLPMLSPSMAAAAAAQYEAARAERGSGGTSDKCLRGLLQEVEILGRCEHPNIIKLLAACLTPPRMFLVLELCETSLDKVLYGSGDGTDPPIPLTTVLHIAHGIARGLEYLHPSTIHRDIKPSNVLLNDPASERPIVKLADFGLSRLRMMTNATDHPDAGTPAYLPPESFDATNFVITHKADIYAYGAIVAEMLAGSRPWQGVSVFEIATAVTIHHRRPPLLEGLPPGRVPPPLRALITSCWEPDPLRRPAAAEIVKSLASIMQEVQSY
ncbi:hypothetical protein HYH03_005232 [Edaphochlamys debaryana]|uniref:Protein kinase domain-containing protein n=1 Tax=Edaphochlamys debaryana TaxID=47281 RepID=A0A836C1E6_9CHLO|nr:hypothetical protein HYH03_005232 [Edaphochlamys debaryana]|eukprot:KAG2496826.1 hypothetical protein HYH03_005232 [Edaphochlamys debaryana]